MFVKIRMLEGRESLRVGTADGPKAAAGKQTNQALTINVFMEPLFLKMALLLDMVR